MQRIAIIKKTEVCCNKSHLLFSGKSGVKIESQGRLWHILWLGDLLIVLLFTDIYVTLNDLAKESRLFSKDVMVIRMLLRLYLYIFKSHIVTMLPESTSFSIILFINWLAFIFYLCCKMSENARILSLLQQKTKKIRCVVNWLNWLSYQNMLIHFQLLNSELTEFNISCIMSTALWCPKAFTLHPDLMPVCMSELQILQVFRGGLKSESSNMSWKKARYFQKRARVNTNSNVLDVCIPAVRGLHEPNDLWKSQPLLTVYSTGLSCFAITPHTKGCSALLQTSSPHV